MSHGKPYDPNQPRHLIGEVGAGQWKKVEDGQEPTSAPHAVQLALKGAVKGGLGAIFEHAAFAPIDIPPLP